MRLHWVVQNGIAPGAVKPTPTSPRMNVDAEETAVKHVEQSKENEYEQSQILPDRRVSQVPTLPLQVVL